MNSSLINFSISINRFATTCLLLVALTFICNYHGQAQCAFDPTVTGDTLLCPNDIGQLATQVYDSYQWYKRPLFGGPAAPVTGATSQTLAIDAANDAGFYFKVEATLNGCTEMSPEVLVDSWVFLLPYTIIEGDYTLGGSGELILCQGDTVFLIAGLPYTANLQWYNNGVPIPGANNDTLFVTGNGSFTFSGAPAVCPNFNQSQFIPSDVVVINCPTGLAESPGYEIGIIPNPAEDLISVNCLQCSKIEIFDALGKLIISTPVSTLSKNHIIDVTPLSRGTYTLVANQNGINKGALLFVK